MQEPVKIAEKKKYTYNITAMTCSITLPSINVFLTNYKLIKLLILSLILNNLIISIKLTKC